MASQEDFNREYRMDSFSPRVPRIGICIVVTIVSISTTRACAQQTAVPPIDFPVPIQSDHEPLLPVITPHHQNTESLLQSDVQEEDDEDGLGELDDLLELADNDIGNLSQVQVSRPSMAPALDTVVSTVERKQSTVGRTPAAVYVITREMIRRSGARHVPEVLRMAPGVQVAQIDANKWAVSIRGFNGRFANKLLVQIDGRSVYNPLFAGVFWDAQGVLLEDIERIEVVRGPGGAVWGANAVNGVINIVTRKAADTHGTFIEGGGGNIEQSFGGFRQGGKVGANSDMRVFGQWTERGALASPTQHDDMHQGRVGARLDWQSGHSDSHTLQGDYYNGKAGTLSAFATPAAPFAALTPYNEEISGGNVLYRWNRKLSEDSDWQIQTYYEQTQRRFVPAGSHYSRHTVDVDFQHRFKWRQDQDFSWGANYRSNWDNLETQPFFLSATPQRAQYNNVGAFAQNTTSLYDNYLSLTLGTKLSYNDFTGGEIQPSARLLWTPTDRISSWLAASRAVRTASRITANGRVVLPGGPVGPFPVVYPVINGDPELEAEDVFSLEAGFRHQPTSEFSWDLAVFWNRYEDLVGTSAPGFPTGGPEGPISELSFGNTGSAQTYGAELASTYQVNDDWSLHGNYTFLRLDFDGSVLGAAADSPQHQFYLQSSHELSDNVELDLIWRYIDSLPAQAVAGYSSFNVRLGWQPTEEMELFVMGTNLFAGDHFEFGNDPFAGTQATQVPRGVHAGLALRF